MTLSVYQLILILSVILCFRIIKGWPNTYTFTKALAEKMLLQQRDGLPIVIVRPSIGKFNTDA